MCVVDMETSVELGRYVIGQDVESPARLLQPYQALVFNEYSLQRVAYIFGFLRGLGVSQPELAEAYAREFFRQLTLVNNRTNPWPKSEQPPDWQLDDIPRQKWMVRTSSSRLELGLVFSQRILIPPADSEAWLRNGEPGLDLAAALQLRGCTLYYRVTPLTMYLEFHGLGSTSDSVTITDTPVWQLHS